MVDTAPPLEQIGAGWSLREQELPSEAEFEKARTRAASLFGVAVPSVRFTGNVAKLARGVREKVQAHEQSVHGLHRSLAKHAEQLGLDETAPRVRSTRTAVELLAKLSATEDPTRLARTLAAAPEDESDSSLSRTITSADGVLRAIDGCDWEILAKLHAFAGRGDGIGERAERVLADLADAAGATEFTHALPPVLSRARTDAVQIITDAVGARPTPPLPPPPQPPSRSRRARRIEPSAALAAQAAILDEVLTDIRAYKDQHPGVEIEIDWRPVNRDGQA